MAGATYAIETVVSAPFEQNSLVLWRRGAADALIVDPGFDPGAILEVIARHALRPAAILNTHGHSDHIAGNAAMKQAFPNAPLIIGKNEAHLLTDAGANLSAKYGMPIVSPEADRLVEDGERLDLAGFGLLVREIPGHSPGSVVFIASHEVPAFVLGGDVLFAGSVGRTDFPGGSADTLFDGIRQKLFDLPDDTLIIPGHGPNTTVGRERRTNPFVGDGAN